MAWVPHSHQMLSVLQVDFCVFVFPASGLWKCSLQLIWYIIPAFLFIKKNKFSKHSKAQEPAFTDCSRHSETWKNVGLYFIAKPCKPTDQNWAHSEQTEKFPVFSLGCKGSYCSIHLLQKGEEEMGCPNRHLSPGRTERYRLERGVLFQTCLELSHASRIPEASFEVLLL